MILTIMGLGFALFILGIIVTVLTCSEEAGVGLSVFGGFLFVVALIATILLGIDVKSLSVIDDRIEMYQEENARIEQQIADVVEQYQKYETDIFMEVAPESAVSMVALYPELKSDSLVQAQIEVYVANNNMIKDLKDQQIKGDVYRWWLYFGGGRD